MNREFAQGLARAKENDFLGAIEFFNAAIIAESDNVEYYAERAVAYLNTNQFDLSMFDMNRCIDMQPNNSYRYSCRAFLKSKIGDMDGAIADYEIAVRLDPDDAIAYNNLGLAQENKGFRKKAEKSFQRSNELIGYNPKKFDEASIDQQIENQKENGEEKRNRLNTDQPLLNSETQSAELVEQPVTKTAVAKGVFTTKKGFSEFIRFIRNGFKLKA